MGPQAGAPARMRGHPQVTAALARCHCADCARLDRLPLRRHGIPHAYQTTFAAIGSGCGPALPLADLPRPATSPDALPLFAGALEPTLF